MAKIVAVSNTPMAPTGYGTQIAQLGLRALAAGHDFSVAANYGAPVNMEWNGIKIYAEGLLKYANDSGPENIALAARDGGFGLTLFDVWTGVADGWHELPLVCWVPVDHSPVPRRVAEWCIKGGNKYIVAMSKNGEQLLLEAGVPRDRLTYIPHAIDRSIWNADVQPVRNLLRVPEDAHLTIITAMNKGKRKSFPEMLHAWTMFAAIHKDAYLYLHTDKWGHMDGINLIPLLKALGAPEDRIRWVNSIQMRAGVPAQMMARLMRSADISLLTTRSEGFCVPVVESQSVGTPVAVSRHCAPPELVRDHGHIVDGQIHWEDFHESFAIIPNVLEILEALTLNYIATKAGEIDRAALAATMDEYDADKVYAEKWEPLFQSIQSGKIRLGVPTAEPQPVNRAQRRAKK
jgi:glycosyltransferase involved in cell wall biosynthesis